MASGGVPLKAGMAGGQDGHEGTLVSYLSYWQK